MKELEHRHQRCQEYDAPEYKSGNWPIDTPEMPEQKYSKNSKSDCHNELHSSYSEIEYLFGHNLKVCATGIGFKERFAAGL